METIFDYCYRVATYNKLVVMVELLFIGLVVYWAVNFLEGTRGERLFRGVIFLLVTGSLIINFVVKQFGFERLQFLYKGFLIAILVIAVAAFQPEIRRALIRIGQPRFLRGSSQQLSRTVEEIIRAVEQLSEAKTGAIIVIEGRVGLGELVDTGVRLDAKVTASLLRTIFHPGTTLHDMGVIIRADRIEAARVQLPLAESGSAEEIQLGSRHRAAIGMSASSDATVIVVSEETGTISLAVNGKLMRNVSDAQLRNQLMRVMVERSAFVERLWKAPWKYAEKEDIV